jgi:hypothetical protein
MYSPPEWASLHCQAYAGYSLYPPLLLLCGKAQKFVDIHLDAEMVGGWSIGEDCGNLYGETWKTLKRWVCTSLLMQAPVEVGALH